MRHVIDYAKEQGCKKTQLVAGEGFLVDFYTALGFDVVRELPEFLPYGKGTLMHRNLS